MLCGKDKLMKMKVIIDGKEEEREIDYKQINDMNGHPMEPRIENVPVLRSNEIILRTIDGKVHIIKDQIR